MKRLAVLAAILPLPVQAAEGPPTAQADAYTVPSGPLILTRTLRRGLPDGKEIVSTRRYEVRIVAEGSGFRVDGRLLDVALDAPPSLAALAEIERKRSDDGLFPLRLDARGFIASRTAARDEAAASRAGSTARTTITASPLSESDRRLSETFVGRLLTRDGAAGGQWPADLFRPLPGRRSESSALGAGTVTTTIERTVTTETGGTRRVSRETYRVEPAPR